MDTKNLQPIVNFIYSVADDVLVNYYEKAKYKDIILPMTVIRRLDAVLEPTKAQVVSLYEQYKSKLDQTDTILGGKNGSGLGFSNHSNFTLTSLLDDPNNIKGNLENYLNAFSQNIQDILEKFEFRNQIAKLDRVGILYATVQKFCSNKINLSPNTIKDKDDTIIHHALSNLGMGYVFEELLRRFNEDENAQAGKHFTPREIISLMTHLVFLPIKDEIKDGTYLVYDNACGSGGILSESKQFITDQEGRIASNAVIHTYGQEASDEIYAICKSDMLIRGENPDNIKYGSTLSKDQLGHLKFDFMLTNPPFGTKWDVDQKELGIEGSGQQQKLDSCRDPRFQYGITDVGDGQMMFMQNMLSKMKTVTKESPLGSTIASIHNGSSLFSGDAGSGESEIRRHIIANDMLEAIIELPKDMFYNTNISTYIWIVTNNKKKSGVVKLINASSFYRPMQKSLGKKRVEMSPEQIEKLTDLYIKGEPNEYLKIFDNDDFGYSKVIIERPKKIKELEILEKFQSLKSKESILEKLSLIENQNQAFTDRKEFVKFLGVKLTKTEENMLIEKDYEKVPLKDDIQRYFVAEVLPFTPSAWIEWNTIRIGYEITFNKYFYEYKAPRKLEEIYRDIKALEEKTENILEEIVGQ